MTRVVLLTTPAKRGTVIFRYSSLFEKLRRTKVPVFSKFCLITATLLGLLLVGGWYVIYMNDFSGMFQIKHVLYAAGVMLVMGLVAYVSIGRVTWRLAKDDHAIEKLERLVSQMRHDSKSPEMFRDQIVNLCANPQMFVGRSRVGEALQLLSIRYDISRALEVKTPINRSVFQNDFEDKVDNDSNHLGNVMVLFFMVGFFGLVASMYLTFVSSVYPKTLEETAQYNSHLLSGLGLSYLLTMLGIGMGLLTHVVKMLIYDPHSGQIFDRFRALNFSVIFPVLHSSFDKKSLVEDSDDGGGG